MQQRTLLGPLQLGRDPNHASGNRTKVRIEGLSFWYGDKQALRDVSLDICANEVTAFIGPSGCGKTTLLKCINRTAEIIPHARMEGRVLLDGEDIYDAELDPPMVRRRFGWVAQRPDPLPRSIRSNLLYAPRLHGLVSGRADEDRLVESVLTDAALWDEVKDRLDDDAYQLSIGQQQRLCVARALSADPEIVLMDEPCSALDPLATALIDELIDRLRASRTVVIITHNIQQAARVSQRIAFFHLGVVVEAGDTEQIILRPATHQCADFIMGRYG